MKIDAFFARKPYAFLAELLFLASLLCASLYGSFALGQPSLLIIISVILTVAFVNTCHQFNTFLKKDACLYLRLDEKNELRTFKRLKNAMKCVQASIKERNILELHRTWYGFEADIFCPWTSGYKLYYLGYKPRYGYGMKLYHGLFGEHLLIRDFSSQSDLFRETLKVIDGSAEHGIHQLIRRAHAFTRVEQVQKRAWQQAKKPRAVSTRD